MHLFTIYIILLYIFRISSRFGKFRVFWGLLAFAMSGLGSTIDYRLYCYFSELIQSCVFTDANRQCFCDATESEFKSSFSNMGDINCNNYATNHHQLLAVNTAFSFVTLCALVCAYLNVFLISISGAVAAA